MGGAYGQVPCFKLIEFNDKLWLFSIKQLFRFRCCCGERYPNRWRSWPGTLLPIVSLFCLIKFRLFSIKPLSRFGWVTATAAPTAGAYGQMPCFRY